MKKISREQFLKAVDIIIQFEAQLVEDGARIAEDIKIARKYSRSATYSNRGVGRCSHNIAPETEFIETNASIRLINLIKYNEEHFGVDFEFITVRTLSEFPLTVMMTWRGFGKKIAAELSSIIISAGLTPRQ